MLKMICEDWRLQGTTREQCISHLAERHAPLVHRCSDALGIVKYIQNIRIPSVEVDEYTRARGWSEAPDSTVEVWFESAGKMAHSFSTPEAAEASKLLEEDEGRFVNSSMISAFLSQEVVKFDSLTVNARYMNGTPIVKLVAQVWKKPEHSVEEFSMKWQRHGEIVRQHAQAMGFARYVQSHTVPSAEISAFADARGWRTPPDGLAEIWWENYGDMAKAIAAPDLEDIRQVLSASEDEFTDISRNAAFVSRENVVFDETLRAEA